MVQRDVGGFAYPRTEWFNAAQEYLRPPLPDNHLDWPFWTQGDRCFRFYRLAWNYFKSPAAQNFGQHNPKLHPGKALANA
jgi:hypothetical protein